MVMIIVCVMWIKLVTIKMLLMINPLVTSGVMMMKYPAMFSEILTFAIDVMSQRIGSVEFPQL